MRDRAPSRIDGPTVAGAGLLVYATAITLHEGAHALVGTWAGASPTLLTSTGTRGDWSALDAPGHLLTWSAGPLLDVGVALAGWLLFRVRGRRIGSAALLGWLLLWIPAWMAALRLAAAALPGEGDWARVLGDMPNGGLLRVSGSAVGLFAAGLLWRGTIATLARLVGGGPAPERVAAARRATAWAWVAGSAAVLLAALVGPLDTVEALVVAGGGSVVATAPLLLAARRVAAEPVPGPPLRVGRSYPLLLAGALAAAVLVGVLGPGVRIP